MEGLAQVFTYEGGSTVRVVQGEDGEPCFVAADVCRVLEHTDTSMAVRGLDDDERGTSIVCTTSGDQEMLVITEAGLYSLVIRSRKPQAKQFKRWITHEVLPSIRKHGGYLTQQKIEEALMNPDVIIRLATDLKAEREQRLALAAKVEADTPKVLFAEAVETSHTSVLVGDLAKIMRQNGVDIGQNRLFKWLRTNGYLLKRQGSSWNMPTQTAMDAELFEIKESVINLPDGSNHVHYTTKVTGKGQIHIINIFLGDQKQSQVSAPR